MGSSPVKTCSIPTLRGRSPQHGRTSKGGGGPTPCSPRRVRNEPESGRRGAAPLPCFLLLLSALPRLPTPHAASRRPTGTPAQFPLGLLRLPGVTGPRRLRSGHGLPVAPPPWCGCGGQFRFSSVVLRPSHSSFFFLAAPGGDQWTNSMADVCTRTDARKTFLWVVSIV